MSLYPNKIQVDGVPCGLILRGSANGTYLAVFEREMAELARIEQIDWSRPAVVGESPLPAGYGFQVRDIRYAHATRSYTGASPDRRSVSGGCGRLPGPVGGAGGDSSGEAGAPPRAGVDDRGA